MLWLALRFPRLAVEIWTLPSPAVATRNGRVVATDAAAEAAGISSGMGLSSALGLAPGLSHRERASDQEAAALARLACWAGQFTPQVSLAPPDELLLEIGGCLRLFGGLPALRAQIQASCTQQGYAYQAGLAPTPLAAQWRARAGRSVPPPPGDPTAALAPLPLAALGLPAQITARLATLGVGRLDDLLALPKAGLARRFGPELPLRLAQALGEVPDPRPPFPFPESFREALELPARVEDAPRLLFAARRLVAALGGWLAARGKGIQRCHLILTHEDQVPTRLELGFASPTRDPQRLQRVLRERLERRPLAAPVVGLALEAPEHQPLPGASGALFGQGGSASLAPVVERLRARLGAAAVHGLATVADHRPEQASRWVAAPRPTADPPPAGPRPLWLLPSPRPLAETGGAPHHGGRLQRLTRAERIESGWWDGGEGLGDQRRDYFVATNPQGAWLWVFRDDQGWWLHGLFA